MTTDEIKIIQRKVGTKDDGIWGEKSWAACKAYLRSLMPSPNPWPKSDDLSMTRFYGKAGDESNLVSFPFPFQMYYERQPVSKTRCHQKVRDSLIRVLNDIEERHGRDAGVMLAAQTFGGVYNFRQMRGGSRPSKHSWGVAIDLAPSSNGLRTAWPKNADMPFEIMECFAREGWTPAGAFWGKDAMHFEACHS